MYDIFSIKRLLESYNFIKVNKYLAGKSRIPNFNHYELETLNGEVRKPDSLFMEGVKKESL